MNNDNNEMNTTFLQTLENEIRTTYGFKNEVEDELENIIDVFNTYGTYLNNIPLIEKGIIEALAETLYDYSISIRDYNENIHTTFKRKKENIPSSTLIKQEISLIKKTQNLLFNISSPCYRLMQGHHGEFNPNEPPMAWQEKKGKRKYKQLEKYCFTNIQDKNIALKAYDETIKLYEDSHNDIYSRKYAVQKDLFSTYWFLEALIKDLENKTFYLHEKLEYYPPEKPSKTQIKFVLKEIKKLYQLKVSQHEKQLIDYI